MSSYLRLSALDAGTVGRRRPTRCAAVLLTATVLLSAQGCYTYRPSALPGLRPGEEMRVTLEESSFNRLAPGATAQAAQRVEGSFVRLTDDSLAVSVWIGEAYRGTPFEAARQEIVIPRSAVVSVEQRRLSPWRTALASAGVVGLVVALIGGLDLIEVFGDDSDGGSLPTPPSTSLRSR